MSRTTPAPEGERQQVTRPHVKHKQLLHHMRSTTSVSRTCRGTLRRCPMQAMDIQEVVNRGRERKAWLARRWGSEVMSLPHQPEVERL